MNEWTDTEWILYAPRLDLCQILGKEEGPWMNRWMNDEWMNEFKQNEFIQNGSLSRRLALCVNQEGKQVHWYNTKQMCSHYGFNPNQSQYV